MKKSILALMVFVAIAPAVAWTEQQEPVRVGGNVQAPSRTKYVAPVYPADAMAARVQGIVILEALIGTDGTVSRVKILKSIPGLDDAARDAVSQWTYTPTTLNGVPVPVVMTVTVNFAVNGARPAEVIAPITNPGLSAMASGSVLADWNGAKPVRIGGEIKAPERTKYVPPVYPDLARDANVTGIVIIEALVDENGNVAAAKALKSIPLLDQAALDAVMQWKYAPTLLNGAPVPVVMTVTVNFSIG